MRSFVAALMVLIVSGEDENIEAFLEDSVLLPCHCSKRDPSLDFRWQKEEPNPTLVLEYNVILNVKGSYEGRAKIFLAENSTDCSVLLTNITAGDHGRYRCSFYNKTYQKSFVNLNVSARYTVSQKVSDNPDGKSTCHVTGRYRETEIQWKLDERLLTNSSTTTITNSPFSLNASTGLYHFYSTLSTKLNVTSKLKCDVQAKGLSANISYDYESATEPYAHEKENLQQVMRYSKIIPIMSVLGFSLVLWRRWKVSQC